MVPIQYTLSGRTVREIVDSVERSIRDAALPPGAPLPSVRALAEQLSVAPGTVAAAYQQLRDRGWLETRGRSGTFVRPAPSVAGRGSMIEIGPGVVDLTAGQPDVALLPSFGSHVRLVAGPPAELVLPDLLDLARSRFAADGVPTPAVTVTSGGLDGIGRVLSAHLRPGDLVAVEDPGWPNLLDLVAALGLRTFPVVIDEAGALPASVGNALGAGARALVVTSRAQNPTGAYTTPERAAELRAVLAGVPETVVIEDDHAAELAGVPLATLAGSTNRWAFVRSVSKPYGPDLRLAVMAGDEATVGRVQGRMQAGSGWVSTILQHAIVELWSSSTAADTVAAAGRAYDERRTGLIEALHGLGVRATGATGINVWIPVLDETTAVTGLVQRGWAVTPGARFRHTSQPGIRVTISTLLPQRIPRFAADVAQVLHGAPTATYRT